MYTVCTNVGKKREVNEDYYLVKSITQDVDLYIVADGLGGYSAGEIASKMCANIIAENIISYQEQLEESTSKEQLLKELLKDSVLRANKAIYELSLSEEQLNNMGTTIVALLKTSEAIYYVSVGDSSIIYLNHEKSQIKKITEDDTYVNTLIKTKVITREQAKIHPQKHVLTKAVGVFNSIEVEVIQLEEKSGFLLLCTDGVTNMVTSEEIQAIFSQTNFENIASSIVEKANEHGGIDNITALVIDI